MDIQNLAILIGSLAALAWAADLFVASAANIGRILHLPKMIIGIVLVGFATTAPELAVSVQSAYLGHPEIALGNALGSVMADDGLALALAATIAATPIAIEPRILKTAALFLISIDLLAYALAWNGTISRTEGIFFLVLLAAYYTFVLWNEGRRRRRGMTLSTIAAETEDTSPVPRLAPNVVRFAAGIVGVIFASHFVIRSATGLARSIGVSEAIISLTVIAFGTSLPEVGACIAAARRREGQIAVGNIIGADILNVLWIIGMSAAVRPITVPTRIINFAFPWMLAIVGTMLVAMRIGHKLNRTKGIILLVLYVLYIASAIRWFY